MKILLRRDYHADTCTLGVLSFSTPSEDFVCQTMERPWIAMPGSKGGLSGKSCVPPGIYKLEPHNSEAHPNTWALVNPDLDVIHYEDPLKPYARALVLIHVANYARELRGCIAPGYSRAVDSEGTHMVTQSKRAMIDIKRLLPWDGSNTLEIK
jgi:Family of unknown function (DUF5675)